MAAFIMIFVHVGGWTQSGRTHGILGIVVTILCFFHPILAVFRPHPKDPKRYRFNIGHYLGGRVAYILASRFKFFAAQTKTLRMPLHSQQFIDLLDHV